MNMSNLNILKEFNNFFKDFVFTISFEGGGRNYRFTWKENLLSKGTYVVVSSEDERENCECRSPLPEGEEGFKPRCWTCITHIMDNMTKEYTCENPVESANKVSELSQMAYQQRQWAKRKSLDKLSPEQLKEECLRRMNSYVDQLYQAFKGYPNPNTAYQGTLDQLLEDIDVYANSVLE